jgi:hypothetical protein
MISPEEITNDQGSQIDLFSEQGDLERAFLRPHQTESQDIIDDPNLRDSLERGPSDLIDEGLIKEIASADIKEVPLASLLVNPRATARYFGSLVQRANLTAEKQEKISELAGWLVEIAGDDACRDVLLNYVQNLEEDLSGMIEPYCRENSLKVPQRNTLSRMTLLLRINSEISALQTYSSEVTRRGKDLVRKIIAIQAETAQNSMCLQELPQNIEAAKQANSYKEQRSAEKTRHLTASIVGSAGGLLVGATEGLFAGVADGVESLVKRHPKSAAAMASGVGMMSYQIISASNEISSSDLKTFAVKSGTVAGGTLLATAIASGLIKRRSEEGQS